MIGSGFIIKNIVKGQFINCSDYFSEDYCCGKYSRPLYEASVFCQEVQSFLCGRTLSIFRFCGKYKVRGRIVYMLYIQTLSVDIIIVENLVGNVQNLDISMDCEGYG